VMFGVWGGGWGQMFGGVADSSATIITRVDH